MFKKISPKVLGRTGLALGAGFVGSITPFLAASSFKPVFDGLKKVLDAFQSDIQPFVLAIGAVALIIAFLTAMLSRDQKASATAWAWVKRIIITLICIIAVPAIIKLVSSIGQDVNKNAQ